MNFEFKEVELGSVTIEDCYSTLQIVTNLKDSKFKDDTLRHILLQIEELKSK